MDTDSTSVFGSHTSERHSTRLSRRDYKEFAGLKIKRKRGSSSEAVKQRKPRNPLPKTSILHVITTICTHATFGNAVPKADDVHVAHFSQDEVQNLKRENLHASQEGIVSHNKPETSGGDATVTTTKTDNDKSSHVELTSRKRDYSALVGIKKHEDTFNESEKSKVTICSIPVKKAKTTNINRLTRIKQRRRGRSRNTVVELVEESVNIDVVTTPANITHEDTAKPQDDSDGADDILLPKQEEVKFPIDMTDTSRSWHEDEFYLNDPPVHRSKAGQWGSNENREIERLQRIKLEKERVNIEWKEKRPKKKLKMQKVQKEAEKRIDDRYHTEATARYNRRQDDNLKVIRNVYKERGVGEPPETDDMCKLAMELKRRVYLKQMTGEGYRIDDAMEQGSYERVGSNLAYVAFENGFGAGACPVKKQGASGPTTLVDRQEILNKQKDLEKRRELELAVVFHNPEHDTDNIEKKTTMENRDLLNSKDLAKCAKDTCVKSPTFIPSFTESNLKLPYSAQTTDAAYSEVRISMDEHSNHLEFGFHANEDTSSIIPTLSSRKRKRKGHASVRYINIHPYDSGSHDHDYTLPKRARGCSEESINEVVYCDSYRVE